VAAGPLMASDRLHGMGLERVTAKTGKKEAIR
jgi:hypothetical protein